MTNWKENNYPFKNFTKELTQKWIDCGFTKKETREWLESGLQPSDANFTQWLRDTENKYAEWFADRGDEEKLREKYNDCVGLEKHRGWLENQEQYNTKKKRVKVVELDIFFKGLEGELDLSDFVSLRKLNCWGNKLTTLIFPTNPINLKELYLRHNKFTGSLDFLSNMKSLKVLDIGDTDFNEVSLNKLPRSLENISYDCSSDCKLTKIIPELEKVKFGFCQKCLQPNTSKKWCWVCAKKEWKKDLKYLIGQEIVEKFIQKFGKDGWENYKLKWIPYEEFTNIEYLAEGGCGKIYRAKWKKIEQKLRHNQYNDIVLKVLHNSQDITLEFLIEMANIILVNNCNISLYITKCWGISQDPKSKNYMIVIDHIKGGNLREYLKQNNKKLNLEIKLKKLYNISAGLSFIHDQNLIHRDLHLGNILNDKYGDGDGFDRSFITDFGFSQPTNYQKQENEIFGVLPYIAPEVLRGEPYTQASDIYSFGIVAYELFANSYPYPEISDMDLALAACNGLRPDIDKILIPQLLKDLIKRCWDADPKKRPSIKELEKIFGDLNRCHWEDLNNDQFSQQIKEIEQEYNNFSQNTPYQIHPDSTIVSKPINTKLITQNLAELSQSVELNLNEQAEKSKTQKQNEILEGTKMDASMMQLSQPLFTTTELNQINWEEIEPSNWTNINPNFTPNLISQWQTLNFTYPQTQDWLSIGLQPTDSHLAAWLRDELRLTPEQLLNDHTTNLADLREQFTEYQTYQEQPPKN